jgi:hypothetical protein
MDKTGPSADLSQTGQLGKGLVLTAWPPRIASLPAFLLAAAYAGTAPDATAAIVPVDAVAKNSRLDRLYLFIAISLHFVRGL